MAPSTSLSTSDLLSLPPEIRNKIWTFTFGHLNALTSFEHRNANAKGTNDLSCHGCRYSGPSYSPAATVSAPLLTCRQIYAEAVNLYKDTLHVHAWATSELQLGRCSSSSTTCTQATLRHLSIRIHIGTSRDADVQEDMRHLWLQRLMDLPVRFPALETLHVTAHLRPPIAFENLVDAVFIAGPLSHLPSRIKLTLDIDYIAEDVMIDHPELGRVWYSDALEEHTKVIEDCMADRIFCDRDPLTRLDELIQRMLQISQEHEQPWLQGLRRRKIEQDRKEAAENRRANASRP